MLSCSDCKRSLPDEMFRKDPSRGSRGRSRVCRECRCVQRGGSVTCRRCGGARAPMAKKYCAPCAEVVDKAARREQKRKSPPSLEARRRQLARWVVRQAIKLGALEKGPCTRCGATSAIHMHHRSGFADAMSWFDVEPLCEPCHVKHHVENP